jgi:membrane protein
MAFYSVRLREAWNWGGLSFRELAVRTYKAVDQHDTLNQAAVVAFYAMLSLVPLLSLILVLSLGARTGVADQVNTLSKRLMPEEAYKSVISDQMEKIQKSTPVGLLSLSILILLWSASSLFVAIMDTTNTAYGVRDQRPWWKKRLLAIVLTLAEIILFIVASLTITVWPHVMGWLGLSTLAMMLATVVQWLVVVIALLTAFALAYFFGPDIHQEWEWITPGSSLGVLALIVASLGFQLYLHFSNTYSATYGALAGVVLMMLWLYLASLALLVGAEINCIIEHAAPHGRSPGQKQSPPLETTVQESGEHEPLVGPGQQGDHAPRSPETEKT